MTENLDTIRILRCEEEPKGVRIYATSVGLDPQELAQRMQTLGRGETVADAEIGVVDYFPIDKFNPGVLAVRTADICSGQLD